MELPIPSKSHPYVMRLADAVTLSTDLHTAARPTTTPSYGAEAEAESGAYEEYYDEEDEEEELAEAIAALEDGVYEDECVCDSVLLLVSHHPHTG